MKILKTCFLCLSFLPLMADDIITWAQKEKPQPILPQSHSFRFRGDAAVALDYFRSLPDGSWEGNTGAFTSLNFVAGLFKEKYGFGTQLGGSYGVYDWQGRGSNATGNTKAFQQQGFLTGGFYRVTPHESGWNAGLVYDAMFNQYFGVFALNPILGQIRGQLSYQFKRSDELGVWATYDTQTSHKKASEVPVKFRAISQVNLFWSHHFKNQAQTTLWAGTPYRRGLMYRSGRTGRYIFGANFQAPLTKTLSVIGHAAYMGASSSDREFQSYAANVCFGLSYSFGGCKKERTYLPLADNSNFLIDTNVNQ
jgi:hypothetical protein